MGGIELTRDHTFSHGKKNKSNELSTDFFVLKGIISAFKRADFISDTCCT
jgi:hypothetical protein